MKEMNVGCRSDQGPLFHRDQPLKGDRTEVGLCGYGGMGRHHNDPTLSVYTNGAVEHPALPEPMADVASGLNLSAAGPYFREQLYFFDCLRRGVKPVAVASASAAETVRIVRAEIESVRTGRPVKVTRDQS